MCWCGIDHRYMDFDYDGNPYDKRDYETPEALSMLEHDDDGCQETD